jgi:hypothetical protein
MAVANLDPFDNKYENAALLALSYEAQGSGTAKGDSGSAAVVGNPIIIDPVYGWDPESNTGDWLFQEPTVVGVDSQGGTTDDNPPAKWTKFARMTAVETENWFVAEQFLDEDLDNWDGHEDLCPTDDSDRIDGLAHVPRAEG